MINHTCKLMCSDLLISQFFCPKEASRLKPTCNVSIDFPLSAVAVAPQAGQADYSAQWVEYYRSMGMSREAEAIEQQIRVRSVLKFRLRSIASFE